MAISVASTVVLIRVLADNGDLHTPTGHIAVGWLVVEDLFTVLVLVLLPAVFGPGGAGAVGGSPPASGSPWSRSPRWSALTFVVGGRVIPWLLDRVAATRSRELFTLTVLGRGPGHRRGVGEALRRLDGPGRVPRRHGRRAVGVQPAGGDRGAADARRLRRPVLRLGRHAVRPALPARIARARRGHARRSSCSASRWPPWSSSCCSGIRSGSPSRSPSPWPRSASSRSSSPRPGRSLGLFDDRATNTLIAARHHLHHPESDPVPARSIPSSRVLAAVREDAGALGHPGSGAAAADEEQNAGRHRAVIVGYGPVGRTLARLLRENEIEPVIIELNMDTVRSPPRRGHPGRLRRRDPSRHARAGRRRRRRRPRPQPVEHARQRAR